MLLIHSLFLISLAFCHQDKKLNANTTNQIKCSRAHSKFIREYFARVIKSFICVNIVFTSIFKRRFEFSHCCLYIIDTACQCRKSVHSRLCTTFIITKKTTRPNSTRINGNVNYAVSIF